VKADNPFNLLLPAATAKVAEDAGVYKATKQPLKTFYLAITAGVFISIAFVFYITATTGTAAVPFGLAKLVGGICFSLGLMLVVVCGADLFTSTVLIVIAKASGRISWGQLTRNWLNVYFGNLVGALFFVGLIWFSGMLMTANGQWGLNVLQTADHKMHHTFIEAVCLGILANLMVCLAVWMSYSGRTLMDKMFAMILPVAMFVASGFEHSIANMFLIPLGIVIKSFAAPEFWQAVGATPSQFAQLNVSNFIFRSLKDLDVFTAPTFDDEEVAEHANLETHFIDSSGLICWDLFKQDADYPFVDWSFSGTTEQEFATLMAIFDKEDAEVYIADYEHLDVYACRIIVPGMSDIYPAEDLLLANNSMGAHLREQILALPDSDFTPEQYLEMITQLDDEGLDDFTRVRELLGIASGKDNGWYTLRVGELKSMLALAGGDLDQALTWAEWAHEFNASVYSDERNNYYRCLQTLLQLALESEREPAQYYSAFVKMYGQDAVERASAAISGEERFHGLFAVDSELKALPAHQALLGAYEKLQAAKRRYWSKA